METDPRPRRAEGAADLETFLVEWKPNPPTPSRRGRTPLETFLVEWKRGKQMGVLLGVPP